MLNDYEIKDWIGREERERKEGMVIMVPFTKAKLIAKGK